MPVYLDFNATTPVLNEVVQLMMEVYTNWFGNAGSRTHIYGQESKRLVDSSRSAIARTLGVSSSELIFTSGATESNNLAILGLEDYGRATGRRHIVSTNIEHNSILKPLEVLAGRGFEVDFVEVGAAGRMDPDKVLDKVRKDTLLVTVMHANNETGVIQPVDLIGKEIAKTDTFFHVDAAQTYGKLSDAIRELSYDLLSITAHKVYGPQGIGALVVKNRRYSRPPLTPLTYGGGQERSLRPGTLPVALIAGFGRAAELAELHGNDWACHEREVKNHILAQLEGTSYVVNGDQTHCLPNCINISFPGVDSEALMLGTKSELAISNGSACTSSDYRPSHVLEAMGAPADSAVRLSWGPQTADVDLSSVVQFVNSFL